MLNSKFEKYDVVAKVTGDYTFHGVVLEVIQKVIIFDEDIRDGIDILTIHENPKETRYVVQNPEGLIHIFNEGQLKLVRSHVDLTVY